MRVDLYLLPFDCNGPTVHFSHTVLNAGRNYDWHDEIRKLPAIEVPKDFSSFVSRGDQWEDTHYGKTLEDCYGDHVKSVEAGTLIKCKHWSGTPKMNAIKAYLTALDPETRVALFWH